MTTASSKAVRNLELALNEAASKPTATKSSSIRQSSTSSTSTATITDIDLSIEEAKSRVAERFFLKKSKRFYESPIAISSTHQPIRGKSRIKSLMSSLKDSVKSTLTNSMPRTKTLSQMTNTLVNTFKGQGMPECLRYLGLATSGLNNNSCNNGVGMDRGIKRKRNLEDCPPFLQARTLPKSLTDEKKRAGESMRSGEGEENGEDFDFAKPKTYECGYCNASYLHLKPYFKHLRRHKKILRCDGCNKSFSHIITKRRHQLQCHKRAIL